MNPNAATAQAIVIPRVVSRIVALLEHDLRREIYESDKRYWTEPGTPEYWISYGGGGPIPLTTIKAMLDLGLLKEKYSGSELHCYVLDQRHVKQHEPNG